MTCKRIYLWPAYLYIYDLHTYIFMTCIRIYLWPEYVYIYNLQTYIFMTCIRIYLWPAYLYIYDLHTYIFMTCRLIYLWPAYVYIYDLHTYIFMTCIRIYLWPAYEYCFIHTWVLFRTKIWFRYQNKLIKKILELYDVSEIFVIELDNNSYLFCVYGKQLLISCTSSKARGGGAWLMQVTRDQYPRYWLSGWMVGSICSIEAIHIGTTSRRSLTACTQVEVAVKDINLKLYL